MGIDGSEDGIKSPCSLDVILKQRASPSTDFACESLASISALNDDALYRAEIMMLTTASRLEFFRAYVET